MTEGIASNGIGDLGGKLLGSRYRLGALLGQGGMGVVYSAMQESLARPIAVRTRAARC